MKGRVAIVMPAYNCGKYIDQTIRAVMSQSYTNWELFVADDCSTDDTAEVIKKISVEAHDSFASRMAQEPPVTWAINRIKNATNLGCDNSRNAAIDEILMRRTEFEFVAFCDSDDVWTYDHLKDAVETLSKSDAKMYYCDSVFQNSNNEPIEVFGIPKFDKFDRSELVKQNFIFVSTVVLRTECLAKFDKFCDPKGDWDMWLRISKMNKVVYSDYVGSIYRWKNEGSYYTEQESNDSKIRVEIKHQLFSSQEDLAAKIEIARGYKNEYIKKQQYELASRMRDLEKSLIAAAPPQRVINYTVVIHPYSHKLPGSDKVNPKNYPHWIELVKMLKQNGFHVTQVGVTYEPPIGADVIVLNATNERLKEILDDSDIFICVDSFFQHFANYHGRNGVVIFGPSDPNIFGHSSNFNVLKDRKYLRPNQFSTWAECEYNADAFPEPAEVAAIVSAMVSSINSVPAT